jgi:DNA-binding IclR family transcriptional regulator
MSDASAETRVWDLLRGAIATRALAIVSELGAADALTYGPRPVEELAQELDANADTLYRLMRALASEGVFAEEGARVFRNTEASELLLQGRGWDDFAHLFGGVW